MEWRSTFFRHVSQLKRVVVSSFDLGKKYRYFYEKYVNFIHFLEDKGAEGGTGWVDPRHC